MSYNGRINFGLLADYDSMEDVGVICEGLDEALEELLEAAKAAEPPHGAKKPAQAPA